MIRKSAKILLEVVAGIGAGVVILASLVVWRLTGGPIPLSFLTPYIEQALSRSDEGAIVRLDETVLTWAGWDRTFDIRVLGVHAFRADGSKLAEIPEMSLRFSLQAMLHGLLAPTGIEIIGPHIHLILTEEGIQFGLGSEAQTANEVPSMMVADLLAAPNRSRALGYLGRVAVSNATVSLDDRRHGVSLDIRDVSLNLHRNRRGIAAELAVTSGPDATPAHGAGTVFYHAAQRRIEGTLAVDGLVPAGFAALRPELAALRLPLGGTVSGAYDLDGGLDTLAVDIKGGAGGINLVAPIKYDLDVQGVELKVTAAKGGRVDVERLMVDLGHGVEAVIKAELTGVPLGGPPPAENNTVTLKAEGVAHNVTTDSLPVLWPMGLAVDARNWVTSNLSAGFVPEANINIALSAPADFSQVKIERLDGGLHAVGVTVNYLAPMPPVKNAEAWAYYDTSRFSLATVDGAIGDMRVDAGIIDLYDLDTGIEKANIDLLIRSNLTDALRLVDHKPLSYASSLGLKPSKFTGEGITRLGLRFPLAKALTIDKVQVTTSAEMRKVAISELMGSIAVRDGNMHLELDNRGMDVTGDATIQGVPAQVVWHENFGPRAKPRSRYTVRAMLDEPEFRALGLDLAPNLTGSVGAELVASSGEGSRVDLSLNLKLDNATLALPDFEWTKPPAIPANARINLVLRDGVLREVPSIIVTGDHLAVRASATPSEDGKRVQRVAFERLVFGDNDMAGTIRFAAGGGIDAEFKGRSFDASPFLHVGSSSDENEKLVKPPKTLSFTFEKVLLGDGRILRALSGSMAHDGRVWRKMAVDAVLPGDKTLIVRIGPEGTARRSLTVRSDDGGAVLKAFDALKTVAGGDLEIDALIDDTAEGHPMKGKALMKDYRLVDAPLAAEVLTAVSLTGIVNLLQGEGIGFARFESNFGYRKGILRVADARAYGASIGFTIGGIINLDEENLDLEGTIVPAYAINAFLGKIPLLGNIITGGGGSGVFAATYKARGTLGEPRVSVNPLAALTPGLLRRVFGIFDGKAPESAP